MQTMVVLKELDLYLPDVLSDLTCSYLSLEDLRLTRKHWDRVYKLEKDSYGLRIPHKTFNYTVWNHRWNDIDMGGGVKLCALAKLTQKESDFGEDYKGEFTHQNVGDYQGDILSSLFIDKFYDTGHPECCHAVEKWVYCTPEEITEEEWSFFSDHWHGMWLPRIVTELLDLEDYELRVCGLDHLITRMFQMATAFVYIGENCLKSALAYIATELQRPRPGSFMRNIWIMHREIFVSTHKAMEMARNEDEEFNEFIQETYDLWKRYLYPPLTAACPQPMRHTELMIVQEPETMFILDP